MHKEDFVNLLKTQPQLAQAVSRLARMRSELEVDVTDPLCAARIDPVTGQPYPYDDWYYDYYDNDRYGYGGYGNSYGSGGFGLGIGWGGYGSYGNNSYYGGSNYGSIGSGNHL